MICKVIIQRSQIATRIHGQHQQRIKCLHIHNRIALKVHVKLTFKARTGSMLHVHEQRMLLLACVANGTRGNKQTIILH